jgi:hypothetical protein
VLNPIGARSPASFVVCGKGDALGVRAQGIGSPERPSVRKPPNSNDATGHDRTNSMRRGW